MYPNFHCSTVYNSQDMEATGRLQSMGSLRVGHDWVTSLSLSCVGGGNGNPLQCSCLENPRDGRAWWAAIYGVAQSRTRLKQLSSSSSSMKQPRCPSADEWIRKLWYIYTMEYYSAIKNNTIESVLIRWMKLEPIIQSEVSQKEKHQYSILTHIYGI